MSKVNIILRVEGLCFLLVGLWLYAALSASWWYFFIFLLFPDIFMLGYLKNTKLGALFYNIGHTYAVPLILFPISLLMNEKFLIYAAVIWFAHISFDRMLGYGLKLDTHFQDTHLGRIGKRER